MMRKMTIDTYSSLAASINKGTKYMSPVPQNMTIASKESGTSRREVNAVKKFQRIVCSKIIGCDVAVVQNHDRQLPTTDHMLELLGLK